MSDFDAVRGELRGIVDSLHQAERTGQGPDAQLVGRALSTLACSVLEVLGRLERRGGWGAAPSRTVAAESHIPALDQAQSIATAKVDCYASESHCARAQELFPLVDRERWLASGTVFQIRGEFAYLNMEAMGGDVEIFRTSITKMGFEQELGFLRRVGGECSVLLLSRT